MNHLSEKQNTANTVSSGGKRLIHDAPAGAKKAGRVVSIGLAATVLLAAGFLLWAIYGYKGIYPNVTFAGVNIGGKSLDNAKAAIEKVTATYAEKKIELRYEDETGSISVLDAGAALSPSQALQAATEIGRNGNVFSRIGEVVSSLSTKREVLQDITVNTEAIKKYLNNFETKAYKEREDSSYQIEGDHIQIDKGVDGQELDLDKIAQAISDRFHSGKTDPIDFEKYLIVEKADPVDLKKIYDEVYIESADAYLDNTGKEPKIVPHVTGISFDMQAASEMIASESVKERHLNVPLIKTEPETTTEKFEQMLFRDVLSEVKTTLNASNLNRTGNVRLAADALNGRILNPGDVFSYNKALGQRTYENGYKDASVYTYDGIEDQLGGGICQTSSTLYMNVIRAGLEIIERANHSYTVPYTPLGEDATVYWGSIDFKFSNNLKYPVKIEAYQKSNYVVVRLLGTKTDNNTVKIETTTISNTPYETKTIENPQLAYGVKKQKVEGHSAYKVESYRVVYDESGKEVSRTKLPGSRYKKLDKVIEVGTKNKPTGTVSPAETQEPTSSQSPSPSVKPTQTPSQQPSDSPSTSPSTAPSANPTGSPSATPSTSPSADPTPSPTPTSSEAPE